MDKHLMITKNKYLKSRGCIKCGTVGSKDVYLFDERRVQEPMDHRPKIITTNERIVRQCDNCSYKWIEKPKDSKSKQ